MMVRSKTGSESGFAHTYPVRISDMCTMLPFIYSFSFIVPSATGAKWPNIILILADDK